MHASPCTNSVTPRLLQQPLRSQHYVIYSVSRIVRPDYCVMQVHVLTQAHCVCNTLAASAQPYPIQAMYADAWCLPRQGSWLFSRSLCPLRWYSTAFILERWLSSRDRSSTSAEVILCGRGPRVWNSLPSHIRTLVSRNSFSRHLKTHFFSSSPTTISDLFLYSRRCVNCKCFTAYF